MATGAGRQVCSEAKCTEVMLWGAHGWTHERQRPGARPSGRSWGRGDPRASSACRGAGPRALGLAHLLPQQHPYLRIYFCVFFWAFKAFTPGLPTPPTRHVLVLLLQPWKP